MINVLRIDSSPRTGRSLSRALADTFLETLEAGTAVALTQRDLGHAAVPFVDEEWIAAAFTPDKERSESQRAALALSDTLISEVRDADLLMISAPMYNYGMPAVLKAWVDQVIRVGETFSFDLARGDVPIEPVMSGKSLVLLTSCGEFGFERGGIREGQDHLFPHLATVARYLGVERTEHIGIEYQEFGGVRHEASKTKAHAAARDMARALASSLRPASRALA